jgi:hypothetical protein
VYTGRSKTGGVGGGVEITNDDNEAAGVLGMVGIFEVDECLRTGNDNLRMVQANMKKLPHLLGRVREELIISVLVRVTERRERGVSTVVSLNTSTRNGGTFSLFESPSTAERDMRARFDLGLCSGVKICCGIFATSVVDADGTAFSST